MVLIQTFDMEQIYSFSHLLQGIRKNIPQRCHSRLTPHTSYKKLEILKH